MKTLYVDHTAITKKAAWPVLRSVVAAGRVRLALSVWNLVEIGFTDDVA
jgi:hypothetical protein